MCYYTFVTYLYKLHFRVARRHWKYLINDRRVVSIYFWYIIIVAMIIITLVKYTYRYNDNIMSSPQHSWFPFDPNFKLNNNLRHLHPVIRV